MRELMKMPNPGDRGHGCRGSVFESADPLILIDIRTLDTKARIDGEQWVLDGEKSFITSAPPRNSS